MLLGRAFLGAMIWFYRLSYRHSIPFASRLTTAAYETASADPKLEESSYADSQRPVTRLTGLLMERVSVAVYR